MESGPETAPATAKRTSSPRLTGKAPNRYRFGAFLVGVRTLGRVGRLAGLPGRGSRKVPEAARRTSTVLDNDEVPGSDRGELCLRTVCPGACRGHRVDLPVQGAIPEWLDGRYLRTAPTRSRTCVRTNTTGSTGDGMVHGIRISGGRALWYRNRWVDSEVTSKALHRSAPPEHGRSPLHGPSANTNVIGFAGRTLALVEAGVACAELPTIWTRSTCATSTARCAAATPRIRSRNRKPASSTQSRTISAEATPFSTPSSDWTADFAGRSRSGSAAAR